MSLADPRTWLPPYVVAYLRDYRDRYEALMLRQWQRPRRIGVLRALLAELQAPDGQAEPGVEDAAQQLQAGLNLETATGAGLDLVGRVLRTPRDGRSDDVYRRRLRVEILVLHSNGHPDDLIAILRAALPAGTVVTLEELAIATSLVTVGGVLTDAEAGEIEQFLVRAKSLGTRVLLVYSPTDDSARFHFSPDADIHGDMARGFGDDTAPGTGGAFAGVLDSRSI